MATLSSVFKSDLLKRGRTRPSRCICMRLKKRVPHSLPLSVYRVPGSLRQALGRAVESVSDVRIEGVAMRVWLSMYGSRGNIEKMVGLAVLGAEQCCAPVTTGVMSTGVWR